MRILSLAIITVSAAQGDNRNVIPTRNMQIPWEFSYDEFDDEFDVERESFGGRA